jgi:Family of unknown function (DUF5335)
MSAATRNLNEEQWFDYFSSIPLADGVLASVELMGQRPGSPPSASPLQAISYDADRDLLELAVGGRTNGNSPLRYFIAAPRSVNVEESSGMKMILVQDASGARTLIRLLEAAPAAAEAERPASRAAAVTSRNGNSPRS